MMRFALGASLVALTACSADELPSKASTTSGASASSSSSSSGAPPAFLDHSAWTIQSDPLWKGQSNVAGDPSVTRDAKGLLMAYSCFNKDRIEVCMARSDDGLVWTNVASADKNIEGRALVEQPGTWHESHETPELLPDDHGGSIYFIGYPGSGFFDAPAKGKVAIGRAPLNSAHSLPVDLSPMSPVVTPSDAGVDDYGFTSPSIERVGSELRMVFTGWSNTFGVTPMAATSIDDGVTWTKLAAPLATAKELPAFAKGGIAEMCLRTGPDGVHYLFFSTTSDPHRIGVARASDWRGPYTFQPTPLVGAEDLSAWGATGPVAPHVLFDGGKARLWFHVIEKTQIELGYAEATL